MSDKPMAGGSAGAPTLTRRGFLKVGALGGAGLVILFRIPLADSEAEAAAVLEPNAWLRVDPDGRVTVWIGRTEMGQGVRTALPMIVAEELEADWQDVGFEQAVPADKYGDMGTGGSTSIREMYAPLRQAGAAARAMLVAAAAAEWKVDPAACRAERGAVTHAASGRQLAYGDLVERAATLPVPQDPPLKDPKSFRLIGTSPARLDGPAKVDGSARFGLDARVPGMLHAVVARCPVFGGKATGFDDAATRAVPGVRDVLRVSSGVAVVADSLWAARRGLEVLRVTWDEGALAALDSAGLWAKLAELAAAPGAIAAKRGEGAAALSAAARTVEAVYRAPLVAHATMEPRNCTAHLTPESCEIWVSSQNATGVQETAARLAGLPKAKVVVHLMYTGGGFGHGHEHDGVTDAMEIVKALGGTVKVTWTREDDMRHDFYRPLSYNVLRAGLDAAGKPVAWTHRMVTPSILARLAPKAIRDGIDPTCTDVAANLPYAIPHLQVELTLADAGVPLGWWRSVSASQNAFVTECFLDEVAAAAGRDPLDLRRELLAEKPRHRAVLELAAAKAGWGTPLPAGRGRGLAVVESFGSFVAQVAEVTVAADGSVRVDRVVCAVDCGQVIHPDLVAGQMESGIIYGLSATVLGEITLEKGRVVQGNFDDYPMLRLDQCPTIEVHLAPSGEAHGGIGEVGVPPIAPAVVNAIAAATGKRVRQLPVRAEDLRRG
jgi:isoquinoline 1-oxidoreductase beta subunit